ncbi:MAG: putative EAL-domain containing protein YkuI [Syntrophus sp. PtaB.Bin001]|nr:MAG: putative EAL-domain containing protein YkuI [Syntrophus sp. PtaB.Bin001]
MTNDRCSCLSSSILKEIISNEGIVVQFQSILSARNHSIIGFEGLIRGVTGNRDLIPPSFLFDAAREQGVCLEFDRLCREKVLAAFSSPHLFKRNNLLFLNLETSFLAPAVVGSGYLLNQVERQKIPPANIVIEIVESDTEDTGALIRFVKSYRECGFNIALDDVGTGHSNFDRISLLRPDIIKIDRSIISGIATDYFKQEIFKSLAKLSKGIGSLILAEGVETKEESLCCIEYGADLLQGYFFSRPIDPGLLGSHEEEKKIGELLSVSRANRIDIVKARRLKNKQYQRTVRGIIGQIQGKSLGEIERLLKEIIDSSDRIDALYIINDEGIQVTDTIMKKSGNQRLNPVFRAARRYENLSHKDYVYQLINTDLKKYTTERYISFATGNLCVTLSHLFKGDKKNLYILCTDFLVDGTEIPA